MVVKKSSEAVIKTARLNPINEAERSALAFIAKQERAGYNFKQIIVDAINYRGGATPEMFSHEPNLQEVRFARLVEDIIGQFAQELMGKIQAGAIKVGNSEDSEADELSTFTRNFANGLLQRQQMVNGDDTDEPDE